MPTSKITSLKVNKQELPKQPVPDLKNTAERFLRSARPLLNENEYQNTQRIVAEFVGDVGVKLQKELLKKYENTDNWMHDWFLRAEYLDVRDPLIFFSNPGTVGPEQKFENLEDFYTFGARVIGAFWDYNEMVKSGKVEQGMTRGNLLDMQQHALLLGTYRRPMIVTDELLHADDSKHIIILSNNHFFKLTIVDNSDNLLSETQLKAVIKDVASRSRETGKSVGLLTANNRDEWADDYHRLKGIGKNAEIMSDIERALFILCLDKELPKTYEDQNIATIRSVQCQTGFSASTNSGNRWHDKTVQFMIAPDGFVGSEFEHSPCEGVPIAVLHDHILTNILSRKPTNENNSSSVPSVEHLEFELDDYLEQAIEKAAIVADKISMDIDMNCFTFDEFGASDIKLAKLSPDSFVQTAIQVAFYQIHGKATGHYESAGLRRFRNTRTECIRSTSIESVKFAEIMAKGEASMEKKKEALVQAIEAHKQIANEAVTGEGVDRHLFGLRMIAKSKKIELPELYKDVGFTRSTYFALKTSQVPFKTASFMCYGPGVPDGYSCCYNPRPDDILFACSSFKSSRGTCARKFGDSLKEALRAMKEIARMK